MHNEMDWQTEADNSFPMRLTEKGLDFKGRSVVFFYFSITVAVVSMIWVITLSARIMLLSRSDPSVPGYYVTIAMICIAVSLVSLHHFYRVFSDRKAYYKQIEIADGQVNFLEITKDGRSEWREKLRKFESISLRHYTYRGRDSWYVALIHNDKSRCFPIFLPSENDRNASEEAKRQLLARMGSRFSQYNLVTSYEKKIENEEES